MKHCLFLLFIPFGMFFVGCDEKEGRDIVVKKPWPVWDVAFSPDGRWLAAGRGYRAEENAYWGGDGEVNVWHTQDWKKREGFCGSFTFWIGAVSFTPDSKNLIAATELLPRPNCDPRNQSRKKMFLRNPAVEMPPPPPKDGNMLSLWEVSSGNLEQSWHLKPRKDCNDSVKSLSISRNGKLIVIGCEGCIQILERNSGRETCKLGVSSQDTAFSPDSKVLASITRYHPSISLYEISSWKELTKFDLECANPSQVRYGRNGYEMTGDWSSCVCFSPDGKQIAVGVSDGSVRLLAADLSKQLRTLQASDDKARVVAVAFAVKADLLAAATPNGIRLFEAGSGQRLHEWGKTELDVRTVALSPDGKMLAVGYGGEHDAKGERRGGFVNVWNTETGQLVKKLD